MKDPGIRDSLCLCELTRPDEPCQWWDAMRVSGPDIGASYLWRVTVDRNGIAWTWCTG